MPLARQRASEVKNGWRGTCKSSRRTFLLAAASRQRYTRAVAVTSNHVKKIKAIKESI
jgi:hypothetical protein